MFALRDRLVADYRAYAESFLTIRDERIKQYVEEQFEEGLLWPEPRLQLNPAFEPGAWIDELVDRGQLHPECRRIFRRAKDERASEGEPLRLHRHQADAIEVASTGGSYVLTTGTGSGKSLAYIVPIVDAVLRGTPGDGRIKAIVVYPMNALANSQAGELEKFLRHGYPEGQAPVTFRRYTGQEDEEAREEILRHPPDILLTNYVMLELLLTRPAERDLIAAAEDLRFLVLDELHTYRGRQGADVAMLCRRVRDACRAERLQCIGTSATLASEGPFEDQREEVARVASRLFGTSVAAESVIGETLRRATTPSDFDQDPAARERLAVRLRDHAPPPGAYGEFIADPLSAWIEQTFGIQAEPGSDRLIRTPPRPLTGRDGADEQLSMLTGEDRDRCRRVIQEMLLAGSDRFHPETEFPAFAFRLHQFLSGGGSVWASLDAPAERHVTTSGQRYVPGSDRSRALLPLSFCRECGQEYYTVREITSDGEVRAYEPREISDRGHEADERNGFLYLSDEEPWPEDPDEVRRRLPPDWIDPATGALKPKQKENLPQRVAVTADGARSPSGRTMQFVPAPFRFCLACGVAYTARQQADFGKLASLGGGGRSTSTTVLGLSALRWLRGDSSLDPEARKLLSFSDNRQDASLQAGHFNDFIEVGLLRSALQRAAAAAGPDGLGHEELTERVVAELALERQHYAADPEAKGIAAKQADGALRNVVGYRLYRDLERGWRFTSPNLEQVGLIEIAYDSLDEAAADPELWQGAHAALVTASATTRAQIARVLLDLMRRSLAIKVSFLDTDAQDKIRQASSQRLRAPWALDEEERLEYAGRLYPRSRRDDDHRGDIQLSGRSGFGQYLRRQGTLPEHPDPLSVDDADAIIAALLEGLRRYGIVERVEEPAKGDDVPGYQVVAAALRWLARDGSSAAHDPIRVPRPPQGGVRTNPFFGRFYRTIAGDGQGLEAREHTAQVPSEERLKRENSFKTAALPLLFCSPTMELGVDIASLNAVNLRNVPPTPANYAQRSGRAGRQGQPALVYTFCSSWNSHDQYFFRRPDRMVSGQVAPPQLDLVNEDLVRAHVHAIWLAETGQALGRALTELLDVEGDEPTLALDAKVAARLGDPGARSRARERSRRVLGEVAELDEADWYMEGWLDGVLAAAPTRFDAACERWRELYRSAARAQRAQNDIAIDQGREKRDREQARRLRREAEAQLDLLTSGSGAAFQSDFYPYRYFASEGFLPGYSFPRLPLSAFIPGRRGSDEFVSRPRFVAVREFGPRAIVYHEGSRYLINKVILPVSSAADGEAISTEEAKQCEQCGYVHPLLAANPEICERCGAALPEPMRQLLRMQNVAARRRDRISSDEEERRRQGFELRTGVRFGSRRTGVAEGEDGPLARLEFGPSATIWQVNLGEARRSDPHKQGFMLDVERGYWAKSATEGSEDPQDPMSKRVARVIPYVEDTRNSLLFEPEEPLGVEAMASLQAALRRGIQAHFQLEESELAADPLPSAANRRILLLFEAAEGGAGVLRRLLEPDVLAQVARQALGICHFDPDTGADFGAAPGAKERCEAGCYDCLLSYSNQRDHALLDRHAVRDLLRALASARVGSAPDPKPAEARLGELIEQAGSELHREWLHALHARGLRLPDHAARPVTSCDAQPDFLYPDHQTAVYVDGSEPREDEAQNRLEDAGWEIVRFPTGEDWEAIFARYPGVFGALAAATAP